MIGLSLRKGGRDPDGSRRRPLVILALAWAAASVRASSAPLHRTRCLLVWWGAAGGRRCLTCGWHLGTCRASSPRQRPTTSSSQAWIVPGAVVSGAGPEHEGSGTG